MQPNDIDSYLYWGHQQGWGRITVGNLVDALRAFLRYGGQQGWCQASLAKSIRGPRVPGAALINIPYTMSLEGEATLPRVKYLIPACILAQARTPMTHLIGRG
jgi:hypothetical protein